MPKSLRLQLLAWLLVPLPLLVLVTNWLSYRHASQTATAVQDRMLRGALRVIAEQTYYRAGELHAEVPPAALELFESASDDRLFYRVVSPQGTLLLGYPELAVPAAALHAEELTYFDATMRGEPVRVAALAHPLIGAPEPQTVLIEIAQTLHGKHALAAQIWRQAIQYQFVVLALAVVLVWLGLRFGMRPLMRLREAVLERHPGALEPLNTAAVPHELAPLVEALNEYVRRLDRNMAEHGRFVAYASHQLRTALTVLNTQLSYALRSADPAAREEALRAMRDGVRNAIRLVNQLLTLFVAEAARHSGPREAQADLAEVVKHVLEELASAAQAKSIDLGYEQHGGALVRGSAGMLHELVSNLVDNAIRYTPAGGVVTARLETAGQRVTLRIEDNGPGIPAEERERVFERFYRLHEAAESGGCGLGLPIVREIAATSGARVALSEPPGGGLAVSVVFA
jgi:two-component system sensor histidine kinase TctE